MRHPLKAGLIIACTLAFGAGAAIANAALGSPLTSARHPAHTSVLPPSALPALDTARLEQSDGVRVTSAALPSVTDLVWTATGLCAPDVVEPNLLRSAFEPFSTTVQQDQAPATARGANEAWSVTLGDYWVHVDPATRSVAVAGPDGAEALARDIGRCIGSGTPVAPITMAGVWRWSGEAKGWRYVDQAWSPPAAADG